MATSMIVRLRRRAADDSGIALVVALMVALLVFILTTAMLADAFHNVVGSARGRERLTSVNAAEAGLSWYTHALESATIAALRSSPWSGTASTYASAPKTLDGMPGKATFTVTATYWGAYDPTADAFSGSPCASPCTNFTATTDANALGSIWVDLRSLGRAGGVARTVRAVVELRPVHSSLAGAFAGIFICELGNRFTITGPSADIYMVGQNPAGSGCEDNNLVVTSGQFTTTGSVFVLNGAADLRNTTKIDGSLWAKGAINLGSGGGLSTATQCSSRASASVLICGDATSLTSTPTVGGTAKVLGVKSLCTGCTLPPLGFSQINVATAKASFPSPTWTLTQHPYADAATLFGTGSAQTPQLWEFTSCPASPARIAMPSGTLYLRGDLALVSPCGFEFGGRVEFRKAPGVTTAPSLYLMTGYTSTACTIGANPRTANDSRDIVFKQNFDSTAIRLYVYTPCKLIFTNQVNVTGQVVARQLYAQGRTTINTVNLLGVSAGAPGPVTSFSARVVNIREI